jgi:transglutaminase-like putative cysteine protease
MPRIAAVLMSTVFGMIVLAEPFDPWREVATYELEYRVELSSWVDAATGAVRVWIPLPASNDHQQVTAEEIESPWKYRITRDDRGNRFVYLEPGGKPVDGSEVVMRFTIERRPHSTVSKSGAAPGTSTDLRRYLREQRYIPLTGQVRQLAEETARGKTSDLERIRANYDHVTRTMRYSKQGKGWGRGDALWACDAKYGNCTDFHSVFIGMCRCQGIPARFVIGFPIPADKTEAKIGGYHCWAEAYERERGWLPVDASEAWKAGRIDDYFGTLPSDRIEFTVGRDLILNPPQAGEPLNFFVYPYVEDDGKLVEGVPWELTVRRTSIGEAGE